MQIVRFRVADATRYGVLEDSRVLAAELAEPLPELAVVRNPVVKL